jgi:cytochrome P450
MSISDFDPFSVSYTADPREQFAFFHREAPLFQHPTLGTWFAHGHAEVRAFLDHPQMTTDISLMAGADDDAEERMERWPITETQRSDSGFSNPAKHARMRKLLNPDFKPTMIRKMAATVTDVVAKQCGALQSETELDVVELVQRVPLTTISRILGLDESGADAEMFLSSAPDFFRGLGPLASPEVRDVTEAAAGRMITVLKRVLEERRIAPRNDLISEVDALSREMGGFDDDDIVRSLVVLLAAGTDTTRLASSLAIRTLLAHPEHAAELRANRDRMDAAVMELLRYDSQTKFLVRIVDGDCPWGEQVIPSGSVMMMSPFAAGWDPKVVDRPDVLDFSRQNKSGLTFGFGPRYCLGVHLAKLQLGAILGFFLDHVPPTAELDTDGITWAPENLFLREVTRMPLHLR